MHRRTRSLGAIAITYDLDYRQLHGTSSTHWRSSRANPDSSASPACSLVALVALIRRSHSANTMLARDPVNCARA